MSKSPTAKARYALRQASLDQHKAAKAQKRAAKQEAHRASVLAQYNERLARMGLPPLHAKAALAALEGGG